MPKPRTLITLVLGFVIGLLWAYIVAPVVFYDSDPSTLQQAYQDNWVKLLAHRNANANANISDYVSQMLLYVDEPLGIVDRLLADPSEAENHDALQTIRPLAENVQPNAATAPQPNIIGQILPFIVGSIVLVVVGSILTVVWNLLIYPFIEPMISRRSGGTSAAVEDIKMNKLIAEQSKVDYSATLGKPVIQKISVYRLGRGQYDDSFSIEDENDRFLGECGAGIGETIGTGDPKVAAIEVWLFDKDDFSRTMQTVFASPYAATDPALRGKLQDRGDITVVQPGAIATLETAKLRLQARIVNVTFGEDGLPPNSFFQEVQIEIAVWAKDAAGTPVAAGVPGAYAAPPPAPVYNPPPAPAAPVYNPPPATTSGGYAPPAGGYAPPPAAPSPYAPPPAAPPRPAAPPSDDPFGGTGDFTPIS